MTMIDEEKRSKILNLKKSGSSFKEIMKETGLTRHYIQKVLKNLNYSEPKNPETKVTVIADTTKSSEPPKTQVKETPTNFLKIEKVENIPVLNPLMQEKVIEQRQAVSAELEGARKAYTEAIVTTEKIFLAKFLECPKLEDYETEALHGAWKAVVDLHIKQVDNNSPYGALILIHIGILGARWEYIDKKFLSKEKKQEQKKEEVKETPVIQENINNEEFPMPP